MSSQHQVTTKAQPGLCPIKKCQAPVLAGVSEGLGVRVDIYEVSRGIEAVAILAGRETYSFFDGCLVRRRGNSPVSGPVLIEHVCGRCLDPPPAAPKPPEAFVPPF